MVADKLERKWLPEVCYAQFILQPHYTDNFQNICEKTLQMHFKVAVRNCYVFMGEGVRQDNTLKFIWISHWLKKVTAWLNVPKHCLSVQWDLHDLETQQPWAMTSQTQ